MTKLKILTLNAWGIQLPWPIGSKDCRLRFSAIAEALESGDYDIVSLQEVWSIADYEMIAKRVAKVLPDSFYFHSGCVGSGVCVFTKGAIRDTMQHRFALNGYAHNLHHADWWGGKMVGLARIRIYGFDVDFYSTHTHAEYDRDNDIYSSHRIVQAYECSQIINQTARGDLVILAGDLNLEANDVGYKLLVDVGGLTDAFESSVEKDSEDLFDGKLLEDFSIWFWLVGFTGCHWDEDETDSMALYVGGLRLVFLDAQDEFLTFAWFDDSNGGFGTEDSLSS